MKYSRVMVLSDIHGNLPVLKQALKDAEKYKPAYILVAGDLCGGPNQDESIRLLQDHKSHFILGNWEQNIFKYHNQQADDPRNFLNQFDYLKWCSQNISSDSLKLLRNRPYQDLFSLPGKDPIRIAHGAPEDAFKLIYPDTNLPEVLAKIQEKVFVCGHTHSPWIVKQEDQLAINPGSLFNTIEHKSESTYGLLDWDGKQWLAELKVVPFDFKQVIQAFETSGLLKFGGPLARAVLLSIQSGVNVSQIFVDYAASLAKVYTPDEKFVRMRFGNRRNKVSIGSSIRIKNSYFFIKNSATHRRGKRS